MVRTQIQLSKDQAKAVKTIATAWGVSSAEVIRQAIDAMVKSCPANDGEQKRSRALRVVGKFGSGKRNVSENHDDYLIKAYSK